MNILIADSQELFIDGMKALVKHDSEIKVVGEAKTGREAIAKTKELGVDLLILDAGIRQEDGFKTMQGIKEQTSLNVNVLFLTPEDNKSQCLELFEAGAKGYIIKNSCKEQLYYAIKKVGEGEEFICSGLALKLLKKLKDTDIPIMSEEHKIPELSKRELEVLQLISDGLTNNEIAEKLFTSRRTVETHRKNLIEKSGMKNTASLIKYAIYYRIIK